MDATIQRRYPEGFMLIEGDERTPLTETEDILAIAELVADDADRANLATLLEHEAVAFATQIILPEAAYNGVTISAEALATIR